MSARGVIHEGPVLSPEDVADGVERRADAYSRDTSAGGICVADGMSLRLSIQRGALVVADGIGENRRLRRFERANHGLRRLVILGSTGFVTLDVLHFCRRLGIGVVVLAPDGTPALTSTPRSTDDARLRRTQALAAGQPVGLDLARSLISAKLYGQTKVLTARFDAHEQASTVLELVGALDSASTIEEVRQIEAAAAALYWQAWAGRPECVPRFATNDRRRVPPHWGRFEGRRSVLASANGNRKAERPTNAIINYLGAVLEAEAILACRAVGLDSGFGFRA